MNTPLPMDKVVNDRYKISRILGQGGQCFVYEVEDQKENKKVVLKELRLDSHDPVIRKEDINLFKKEFEILSRLDHPGLPKGYDYFQEGEEYFLVVERIEGKNVEAMLRERGEPFDQKQVVEWGIDMVEILKFLIKAKPNPIVVRDIKPSNIVISNENKATLIDFTVAREDRPFEEGDTVRIGSSGYAPPEQYKGHTDYKSDIYALGATLHRLVTGSDPSKNPFQIEPIREHNPDLSKKLEYIIYKMLELDPTERYQDLNKLLDHLKSVKDELCGIEHPEFDITGFAPTTKKKTLPPEKGDNEERDPYGVKTTYKILAVVASMALILSFILSYKSIILNHRLSKGEDLILKGDFPEAEKVFKKILSMEQDNPEALYYLGVIFFYRGDKPEGKNYLQLSCSDLNFLRVKIIYHYDRAKQLKTKDPEQSIIDFEIAEFLSGACKEKFDIPDKL